MWQKDLLDQPSASCLCSASGHESDKNVKNNNLKGRVGELGGVEAHLGESSVTYWGHESLRPQAHDFSCAFSRLLVVVFQNKPAPPLLSHSDARSLSRAQRPCPLDNVNQNKEAQELRLLALKLIPNAPSPPPATHWASKGNFQWPCYYVTTTSMSMLSWTITVCMDINVMNHHDTNNNNYILIWN